jgi:MFS family permease
VNLSRYLEVLRTPGVARLALFTLIGRFPFAIVGLSIVLLMRREDYGYGEIGAVLAGEGVAIALTAAFVGRLADRTGRTRVILACGGVTALALVAETASILSGAAVVVLVALAAIYGATIPPISASMRSLWGLLVPEERVESAYAFDAVQLEVVFIIGPLVAAGLATAYTPAVALFLCAGLYSVAATGFATAPAVRAALPDADALRTRAGALGSPGIRTLVTAGTAAAISFGAIEVALPAFTEQEGSRAAAGPLITAWAIGSVVGGLWYGSRTWRAPAEQRLIALMALLALGTAPIAFAWSIVAMGALLVLTGLSLAPLSSTQYALVERLAPPGTSTEAYSWHIVATAVGSSTGALLAGVLVEQASVRWALASAALACAAGFLIALARRRTLRPVARAR